MKCDTCLNKSICKYVENALDVQAEVKEIHIFQDSPIKINIECGMYKDNCCTLTNTQVWQNGTLR